MPHYDLAVIGSGSGNSLVIPELDDWRIAIVEESTFGGTCLNVGCIPTKMYVYPADLARAARDGGRLGVDAAVDKVRWRDIRDRVFGRIDPISAGGREYRRAGPNTDLYETHARFLDAHTLALGTGETHHRGPGRDRDRVPTGDPRRGDRLGRPVPHQRHGHAHRRRCRRGW